MKKVTVTLSDTCVRTRHADMNGPFATCCTLVPRCRSPHEPSLDRTPPTKVFARASGSRPTVWVSPKAVARWAPGIRNERVASCFQPWPWKVLLSQGVAATFCSA